MTATSSDNPGDFTFPMPVEPVESAEPVQPVDPVESAEPVEPVKPAKAPRPSLFVATPCYGCMLTDEYVMSLLKLQIECGRRGIDVHVEFMGNESLVQRARNLMTAVFLASPFTHLLFIDADIAFEPESVFRLLDADKDIAAAVYPQKSVDWEAVADKLRREKFGEPVQMMGLNYNVNFSPEHPESQNGFMRVHDVATGFMLIKRESVQTLVDTYRDQLRCANDLPGRGTPGYIDEYVAIFDCMIDPRDRRYLSEDYALCRRAQAAGLEVWADMCSTLRHIGTNHYTGDIRQRFRMVYDP